MKRLFQHILVCLCSTLPASAQIYFDRLYDTGVFPYTLEGIWAPPYQSGDGYVFVTLARNGTIPEARLAAFVTDELGEVLSTSLHGAAHEVYKPEGFVVTDEGFAVFSSYGTTAPPLDYQFRLSFMNVDLEVTQEFDFGDSLLRDNAINMIKCHDNGFLMIGQAEDPSVTADMFVVRTNRLGNLKWMNTYGGDIYDAGISAVETPDSGFFLLGWTASFGNGQRDFYLVKTDSLGNQEWQRTYGGGGDEGGFGILRLSDSNYLLTGAGSQGSSTSIGRLYKIRPDGSVLWAKTYLYPGNSGNNLYKTIEMPNGDLVSVGLTDRNNNNNGGWLVRTDSEGNVLWHREYNKNELTDLFYSVLPTDDGGFLLSGQAMNLDNSSQDAWLLKVDSVGCPYPNCTVGVDEMEKSKVVVDVWPNPASEVVNVQWHTGKNAIVTFTDMLGRSYSPPAQEVQGVVGPYVQYDVSTFENGLYLLTIVQNESKTTLRVVVQR